MSCNRSFEVHDALGRVALGSVAFRSQSGPISADDALRQGAAMAKLRLTHSLVIAGRKTERKARAYLAQAPVISDGVAE